MTTPDPAETRPTRKASGIVVPNRLKWHGHVASILVVVVMRILASTLRYRWEIDPEVWRNTRRPVLFCTWHNRLALAITFYNYYARQLGQPQRLSAMVSASKDGALMARILELLGVKPVRGSSSRRGPQALLELTTMAKRGFDLALTVDGPRGPRYVAQSGAIALAQLTGAPIIPASYHVEKKICLKSWDRFQIPLPFSRVVCRAGAPMVIPATADEAERERLREELTRRLLSLQED